jgi:iron(III) transport system ATP-binding protein
MPGIDYALRIDDQSRFDMSAPNNMIEVRRLRKTFSTSESVIAAVHDVDFEVTEGEIFTLLGPSGCGKTTVLRCIAGLEQPDSGELIIAGQKVFENSPKTIVPAHKRGVGMVFQSYAIWPHMTVYQNVALPLERGNFKIKKSEIRGRVLNALRLVQLEGMEERPAPLLSGGQQQRVALARALVYEPKVLLLDEPLSNLDAKLRADMRFEIREIVKRLTITSIYVTHDQDEALVLSDRIAVMRQGRVVQIGSARDIYLNPVNSFVAGFIGEPNLLAGTVENGDGVVRGSFGILHCVLPQGCSNKKDVLLMIRPSDLKLHRGKVGGCENMLYGNVRRVIFLGNRLRCEIGIGSSVLQGEFPSSIEVADGDDITIEIPSHKVRVLMS